MITIKHLAKAACYVLAVAAGTYALLVSCIGIRDLLLSLALIIVAVALLQISIVLDRKEQNRWQR